jgi:methyl-accepting chemotaxis protein
MRLGIQTKVSGFLVLVLAITFGVSTWFSTSQTGQLMEEQGQHSQAALRKAAYEQARNVFESLEIGTKGSLERGEMGVFNSLLADLGGIQGVVEMGLANPAGQVTYTSVPESLGNPLDPEAFQTAASGDGRVWEVEAGDAVLLLRAHRMEADCLRCHDQAAKGDLAGVLYVRYALTDLVRAEAEQASLLAQARQKGLAVGITTGGLGLLVTAIGIFFFLGALVRRPLALLIDRAREMASGDADLTARLPATARDEMGDVARAFNGFVENLQGLVRDVLATAQDVTKGNEEILCASRTVLERATQQSDQTQAAATAAEEMSATVLQVSKGANEAAEVARSTTETAEAGGQVVAEGVAGMDQVEARVRAIAGTVRELGERSQAIGEVMQVIDDIADQTNLLALNAAIEAARAGEHGRGFAVVADEVRKLSEKTAQATRQVRDTVAAIQTETDQAISSVKEGLDEVDRSGERARRGGEALREIVAKIDTNSEMVSQIAMATQQQSATVSEISQNLDSIANLAAEVVTGVQETSGTAEGLGEQTRRLEELVGRFRV